MRSSFAKMSIAAACLLASMETPSQAACDVPTIAPEDIPAGPLEDGSHLHIVTGTMGICDMAIREFEVALPGIHGVRSAKAQLAIAGFTRRYGVRQIGFALQTIDSVPTADGVKVRYVAAIDGLDRYQLAYTLYVTAHP